MRYPRADVHRVRLVRAVLLALVAVLPLCTPAHAQQRRPAFAGTPVIPQPAPGASLLLAPGAPSRSATLPRRLLDLQAASERPWWKRHPTLIGAVAGAALGLGGYYASTHNDPYCRDPDMFPCELAIPVFVVGGAAGGALLGYLLFHERGRPHSDLPLRADPGVTIRR